MIAVTSLFGKDCLQVLDAVAALRVSVFRDYPYLYDGDLDYERRYLRDYANHDHCVIVIATAQNGGSQQTSTTVSDNSIVGASTAMPLLAHGDAVAEPVRAAGINPADVYYFGESVLDSNYRKLGIGHRFFDERERAAARFGYQTMAFCAVDRSAIPPPADYHSLEPFWRKRGFSKREDIVATMHWRDVGEANESAKRLPFWLKQPTGTARQT